jgi:hypothetical protein
MVLASLGYIAPTFGAVLQEGIDVAVILNALRSATGGPETKQEASGRRGPDGAWRAPRR